MNVIYNSDAYYVVQYTEQLGYEIVDKVNGLGGYLSGEVAAAFIEILNAVAQRSQDVAQIDAFVARYAWAMLTPQWVN